MVPEACIVFRPHGVPTTRLPGGDLRVKTHRRPSDLIERRTVPRSVGSGRRYGLRLRSNESARRAAAVSRRAEVGLGGVQRTFLLAGELTRGPAPQLPGWFPHSRGGRFMRALPSRKWQESSVRAPADANLRVFGW
jgi:hypothetical protein